MEEERLRVPVCICGDPVDAHAYQAGRDGECQLFGCTCERYEEAGR